MRADSHYVEQFDARPPATPVQLLPINMIAFEHGHGFESPQDLFHSIRRHGILQPLLVQRRGGGYRLIAGRKRLAAAIAAGLSEVPCLLHHVDDDDARLLAEATNLSVPAAKPQTGIGAAEPEAMEIVRTLRQSFATIASCVNLLRDGPAPWSRKVAIDLVEAEAWRSSCLADALRVVRGDLTMRKSAVRARAILEEVVRRSEAEGRLRGIPLNLIADVTDAAVVAADEYLLTIAVAGAVATTVAVLDGVAGAGVTLAVSLEPVTNALRFAVSQQAIAVASWPQIFDQTWVDRPGGESPMVLALAARRIAELHGGHAEARVLEHGTSLALVVPSATPAV